MNAFLNSFFLLDVSLRSLARKVYTRSSLKYVLISTAIVLLVVLPSLAQSADILQSQLNQMQNTQAWWDDIWLKTYSPPGGLNGSGAGTGASDYMFANIVKWIFSLSVFYFVIRLILKSGEFVNGNMTTATIVLAPMLITFIACILLLSNNGQISRSIPIVMRDISNSWRNGLMQARITDLTAKQAFDDIFATKAAQNKINLQAQQCAVMPIPSIALPSPTRPTDPAVVKKLTPAQVQGYDYLDCLEKLAKVSREVQATCPIINVGNCGPMFRNFLNGTVKRLQQASDQGRKDLQSGKLTTFAQGMIINFVAGQAKSAAAKPLFTSIQWCFINSLELALWVDGLVAPIAVALMWVPGRLNMFLAWFISLVSICLAQLMYTLIAGINALLIAQTTVGSGDLNFEIALGVFAPLMSLAVLGGGGLAAAQSFTGQSVAVGAAVATAASGAISASMSRLAATRRW